METILIIVENTLLSVVLSVSLNPFYIMETILMLTSPHRGLAVPPACLNPFYIMETILIVDKNNGKTKRIILVLIHSTSWKLF